MRRIVTASDTEGKSYVVSDGMPPRAFHFTTADGQHSRERVDNVPDLGPSSGLVAELWSNTPGATVDGSIDPVSGDEPFKPNVKPGQVVLRQVSYGPGYRSPMHRTSSLDFNVVVAGSVTLILSSGPGIAMEPGDSVVIPATEHAWLAGPDGCTVSVVNVGMVSEFASNWD
ncbi:hypothetical protein CH281_18610 [Rhodococcus sp. 06-221-2]|nr:hypothetical protein CH281_18610 [Rhodococcus sp. 06-221-2]